MKVPVCDLKAGYLPIREEVLEAVDRCLQGMELFIGPNVREFEREWAAMEATLSALGKRVFLMQNVHEPAPQIFQTRWTMSYLAGPLTRTQGRRSGSQSHQYSCCRPLASMRSWK